MRREMNPYVVNKRLSRFVYAILTVALLAICEIPKTSQAAVIRDENKFIVKVRDGMDITAALARDGTVWAWGEQLSVSNNSAEKSYPDPQIIPGFVDIVDIQTGFHHLLALRNDGTVWMMGWNDSGQRGDGTNTSYKNWKEPSRETIIIDYDAYEPVQVPGLIGITGICATTFGGMAWNAQGDLWEWGDVSAGAISVDDKKNLTPQLRKDVNDVAGVSSGIAVDVVLKKDGTVAVMSGNSFGQWGDGSRITNAGRRFQFMPVPGVSDVVYVETPGIPGTVIAYRRDGTVLEWGGVLLRPKGLTMVDYTDREWLVPVNKSPVKTPTLQGFRQLAVLGSEVYGRPAVLGLKTDGTIWSQGDNSAHLLGNSNVTERYSWARVAGLPPIVQFAGHYSAYAVGQDGSLWGWGTAHSGQLGNVEEPYQDSPMPIGDFVGDAVRVKVNEKVISAISNPETRQGTLVVNLKDAVGWFGAKVMVDEKSKTVKIVRGKTIVVLKSGSNRAIVNGTAVTISFAPFVRNGAWFVPVEELVKRLGGKSSMSSHNKTLNVTFIT
jgi:alpha-tubulin suppressor-like RCC1 family protein